MSFLEIFDREYAPELGKRAATFRRIFEELVPYPLIVETGSVRFGGTWICEGRSTILFDRYVKECGGSFVSIDIEPACAEEIERLGLKHVSFVCDDSITAIHKISDPIDVLYLDGSHYHHGNPEPSERHHLMELCAANLQKGSIVLVDDTWPQGNGVAGKGKLVCEYMKKIGAEELTAVIGEWQMAWRL